MYNSAVIDLISNIESSKVSAEEAQKTFSSLSSFEKHEVLLGVEVKYGQQLFSFISNEEIDEECAMVCCIVMYCISMTKNFFL